MAFSLGDVFRNLTSGKGEGSVLGIDIGSSSVKIVQLRPSRGAAILETYGEIALGPYAKQPIGKPVKLTPDIVGAAIKDLMRQANVTAKQGGISIPFSSSLVTILELPKVDPSALKQVVPIEARKYIPVPISEVSLDWFVIPEEEATDSAFDQLKPKQQKAPTQEILLVGIQNATLQSFQAITTEAGVHVDFYEIEIFSAIRSALSHGLAPVLVVDIGASSSKMYIVERGIVRLTHLVTMGGAQMTDVLARSMTWEFEKAERVKRERGLLPDKAYSSEENERINEALLSTLTRVFSEVNKVLLSYGQRYNKNVSRVVLTGGGASLPGISAEAKRSLNAEVETADPFSRTEAPAFLGAVLRDIGPGFTVSTGLALRNLRGK
ncbi:MAG TPA: type IV pilus assembly protein PilM [Candidatus Paceibacterota bacterium]|jgi:type IV pilus assembly protein PilM|nr:type IV pilus assembly protein PilM [Candidatus Paceibacterota bacterium]